MIIGCLGASSSAHADDVICSPVQAPFSGSHNPVWGALRDSCSFTHAQPQVEGWVRGWGKVDRGTGVVETVVELETDHLDKGPCGKADVELWGGGKQLAHLVMDANHSPCINGKPPGSAAAKVFTFEKTVPASVASQTQEVRVYTQVLGTHFGPFGWDPNIEDIIKFIQVVIAVAS
jgi:hypothetical protein